MPAAGEKKKFKFEFEVDLLGNKIKELKFDFHKEVKAMIENDRQLKNIVKPIKFKVEAELDADEWDEEKIVEDGYCTFRGQVKQFCERVRKAVEDKKPGDVKKEYDSLVKIAEKGVTKWIKDEASGKADNDKSLKAGTKALEGMEEIDPEAISKKPRLAAIEALEPFLSSGGAKDEKAKEKAGKALKAAYDEFKKNGGGVNDAVKALLDMAKKTGSTSKDASLMAFGVKVGKDKGVFKSMSRELDVLAKTLKEASEAASDGKLDEKAAETYTDILKEMKSLDGSVSKGFELVEKHGKEFDKIKDKLSK